MNIKPPQITESVSELKSLLRKTPVGYQKQRLTALYLFRSGQATTRKQAAALIGVHRKTIGHWLATYTKLTGFVARGLWVLLTIPTLSENF